MGGVNGDHGDEGCKEDNERHISCKFRPKEHFFFLNPLSRLNYSLSDYGLQQSLRVASKMEKQTANEGVVGDTEYPANISLSNHTKSHSKATRPTQFCTKLYF